MNKKMKAQNYEITNKEDKANTNENIQNKHSELFAKHEKALNKFDEYLKK